MQTRWPRPCILWQNSTLDGNSNVRSERGHSSSETERQRETQRELRRSEPKVTTRTVLLPTAAKPKPQRETYAERLERLGSKSPETGKSALEEAQEAVAEVAQVMEEKGLAPTDVTVMLAVDITGEQDIVCAYCGRHYCTYRPTTYRVKNPEIDLLGDTLTSFQEAISEAGFNYGFIVYDDDAVLELREPGPPKDQGERAKVLERYFAFRDRFEYPDPTNRGWLDAKLAEWQPCFATLRHAGEPLDRGMFNVAFDRLGSNAAPIKSLMIAKSRPMKESTHGISAKAQSRGIQLSGVAIGQRAKLVANGMAFPSAEVSDYHALRDEMSSWMRVLRDQMENTKPA